MAAAAADATRRLASYSHIKLCEGRREPRQTNAQEWKKLDMMVRKAIEASLKLTGRMEAAKDTEPGFSDFGIARSASLRVWYSLMD
jgi:hypothetical protein